VTIVAVHWFAASAVVIVADTDVDDAYVFDAPITPSAGGDDRNVTVPGLPGRSRCRAQTSRRPT
jgi:hypothetical protein